MTNKTTKMTNFTAIRDFLLESGKTELAEVMAHEMELLAKKNAARSTAPTKTQVENAEIKADVLAKLVAGRWYRCSEIKELNATLAESNGTQRTSAICNALVAEGKLQKMVEKRIVYFALAD